MRTNEIDSYTVITKAAINDTSDKFAVKIPTNAVRIIKPENPITILDTLFFVEKDKFSFGLEAKGI